MITKQMQNILFPLTSGVAGGLGNYLFAIALNKFSGVETSVSFWEPFLYGTIITGIVMYLFVLLMGLIVQYFTGEMAVRVSALVFIILAFAVALLTTLFAEDKFYIWAFFAGSSLGTMIYKIK